jgi:tungstate transport system substrate-binding protein
LQAAKSFGILAALSKARIAVKERVPWNGWDIRGGKAGGQERRFKMSGFAQSRHWRGLVLVAALCLLLVVGAGTLAVGCGAAGDTATSAPQTTAAAPTPTSAPAQTTTSFAKSDLVLATTTSTKDSGLLDTLIPEFTKAYPQYTVKIVAVGSGEALKMGETGDADVLLVHSPAAEKTFMDKGFGLERKAVMYNDFVLVGPATDPAKIKGMTVAADAFKKISEAKAKFFTRGDDSGTYTKEMSIWKAATITPQGDWYQTTGQGMGDTLTIADQASGYTLSDRATYLSKKASLALAILVEGDKALFNQYHVITVKSAVNAQGAADLAAWLTSDSVQKGLIAVYGTEKFGQALFAFV